MTLMIIVQLILTILMCALIARKKYLWAIWSLLLILATCVYGMACSDYGEISLIISLVAIFVYLLFLVLRLYGAFGFWMGVIVLLGTLLMPASLVLFPLGLMFLASIFCGYSTYRTALLSDVLSILSTCISQDMPLSTGLAQAAKNNNASSAKVLNKMSGWLSQGYTLSESMKRSYGGFPGHVITMVEMSEKVNQLPNAAKYLKHSSENANSESWASRMGYDVLIYPFVVCMMAAIMIIFQLTFIIPKFKAIFSDMDTELPKSTEVLIGTARIVSETPLSVVLLLLPIIILFTYFRRIFFVRKPYAISFWSNLGDTVKWYIPVWHWFENVLSHIRIISYLKLAIAAGVSLDVAISDCIALDVNLHFRRKLKKWHSLVVTGMPVSKAASRIGILKSLAWCFDTELGPDSPPEALDLLESHLTSNYRFKCNMVQEYTGPVTVIICSLLVGFFCYSIFVPLVQMIYNVMPLI